jgi:hypothetical protein
MRHRFCPLIEQEKREGRSSGMSGAKRRMIEEDRLVT